jgi:uncharacterized protein
MWEPGKPSQNENEYFAKRDAEWLRERRATLDSERKTRGESQPAMNCPRCDGELKERDFQHVKIDVCGSCNGVWFDGGELEMVLHMPRAELLRAVGAVASA